MSLRVLCTAIIFISSYTLTCQPTTIYETWPELDVYVRMTDNARLMLLVSETRDREMGNKDMLLGVHVDVGLPPLLRSELYERDSQRLNFDYSRIRVGVQYMRDFNLESPFTEYRATVQLTPRFRITPAMYVDVRNRVDIRFREDDVFWRYALRGTWNYRFYLPAQVTLDPYVFAESFTDSRYGGFVRALFAVGTSVGVNSWLSPEINYTHMYDWKPAPRLVHAVNIILNITI